MFASRRSRCPRRKRWRKRSLQMLRWRCGTAWRPLSAARRCRRKKGCTWKRRCSACAVQRRTCARGRGRSWRSGRRSSGESKPSGADGMATKIEFTSTEGGSGAGGSKRRRDAEPVRRIAGELNAAGLDALERAGAENKDTEVIHVPGAFELPLAAKKLAASGRYDALIAIGCVLRGET